VIHGRDRAVANREWTAHLILFMLRYALEFTCHAWRPRTAVQRPFNVVRITMHELGAPQKLPLSAGAPSQCEHANKNPSHASPCSILPRFITLAICTCVPGGLTPLVVRA
jgi:hypothetical protein